MPVYFDKPDKPPPYGLSTTQGKKFFDKLGFCEWLVRSGSSVVEHIHAWGHRFNSCLSHWVVGLIRVLVSDFDTPLRYNSWIIFFGYPDFRNWCPLLAPWLNFVIHWSIHDFWDNFLKASKSRDVSHVLFMLLGGYFYCSPQHHVKSFSARAQEGDLFSEASLIMRSLIIPKNSSSWTKNSLSTFKVVEKLAEPFEVMTYFSILSSTTRLKRQFLLKNIQLELLWAINLTISLIVRSLINRSSVETVWHRWRH